MEKNELEALNQRLEIINNGLNAVKLLSELSANNINKTSSLNKISYKYNKKMEIAMESIMKELSQLEEFKETYYY